MLDDLTEDEEIWWHRAARVIAGVLAESYEKDWMGDANCLVESPDDKRFIERGDWEPICKQCPVSMQCLEWADKNDLSGVYIAGEYRE